MAMPLDALGRLPHVVRPDIHYDILSKACLAVSGLPTPQSQVIHLASSKTVQSMATRCPGFFPDALPAFTQNEIDDFQIHVQRTSEKALKPLLAHVLPFVLKQTLTVSSGGTYIVHTEAQRQALISRLQSTIIPLLLSSTTKCQRPPAPYGSHPFHLHPCCRYLRSHVHRQPCEWRLPFHQLLESGFRQGRVLGPVDTSSTYDYLAWRYAFGNIMSQVGIFLFSRGYYGPVWVLMCWKMGTAASGSWI